VPDAVVIAAGRISGAFAERAGTNIKALIDIAGRPLVDYVLSALRECEVTGRIALVGPRELLAHPSSAKADLRVQEVGSGPDNFFAGIEALEAHTRQASEGARAPDGESRVLLCASDLPHLTPTGLKHFLERVPPEAEIAYAFSRASLYMERYPGVRCMRVRLREGVFTGGSVQLIDPAAVQRNLPLFNRVFRARKSKLGMGALLGFGLLLRFALGILSIQEIEARARQLTGCEARGVLCEDPGLAFDIDLWQHLELARKMAAAGTPS